MSEPKARLPFGDAASTWFAHTFDAPTEVQTKGWKVIASGDHALLVAPTGSGKTLAAFLYGIDALSAPGGDRAPGVRLLYVSPLKALVHDIERNLRAPLVGIQRAAERLERPGRPVRVAIRTGDTAQRERAAQARNPAEILVTTPESLFLILGSKARQTLTTVETVIVDEVHALAPSKRGAHLALSLERLAELTGEDPQRIGLSATVRPVDEVALYLGGDRPVSVVDCNRIPNIRLQVCVPVPDMEQPTPPAPPQVRSGPILAELYAREVGTPQSERGIWPAIYPQLLEHVLANRSTIVFVNSRGLAERLAQRLNEMADEELVLAHHGSIAFEQRTVIEERLKSGQLRGIVATSSLELGIDMGSVDLVLLVESPGSVSRGLQRVGRSGHHVGVTSAGFIYPKFRADLLESAVVAERMLRGEIEALDIPRNPLDVLCQQLVAMCCDRPRRADDLERVARRAYPYRDLAPDALHAALDMLSGRYPSSEFADLRPRLAWDRGKDQLSARRGTALVSRMNAGTIPDRGHFPVHLGDGGPRVGELDEEMVFETRTGDLFLLGASTWRVESISRDRVVVSPAPGEPGRMPFWRGDGPGRPIELGRAVGAFTRELAALDPERGIDALCERTPLDAFAARNLLAYVHEQVEHTGAAPTDQTVVIERFRDELGDWRVCILSPFGARVHAPWAMALERRLSCDSGFEMQLMYTDDGIVLRFADTDELPGTDALLPSPEEVAELVTEQLADTALFAGLFRENAVRSLLVPRRRPGERNPLWAQRMKSRQLLAAVRRYPGFPVVLETYRQALSDVFDMRGLERLLTDIRARTVRVHDVQTRSASPFARSLVFAYVAAYIYEQDAPLAERKAQALTLDRNLLQELLGQAQLRELIEPQVLEELEAELQQLSVGRQARDADELHDLLRRLGHQSAAELGQRSERPPGPWLERLVDERRAVAVSVAGEPRFISADDAAVYRDALGCMPPPGLPADYLAPVEHALDSLVRRYARTHGPFPTEAPALRFGLRPAQLEPVLRILEHGGELVRGEIRPGGATPEWCDPEVLGQLKRRTLARLRNQAAAVDDRTLVTFLPAWQGIGQSAIGTGGLEAALVSLEGLPLPWSTLSRDVLPARVADFRLDHLDVLCASGTVAWIGHSPLGIGDGRVMLFRRGRVAELHQADPDYEPPGPLHGAALEFLEQRGASFVTEIEDALRATSASVTGAEFSAVLWDLVWAGQITNDTFAPLRGLGQGRAHQPVAGGSGQRGTRSGPIRALSGGRWSLVSSLLDTGISETVRAVARAGMLLERYGIVSREAVAAEAVPGGFTPVYRALVAMEDAGRVRRGYFIEGLSGAQFGHVGAVDRLRAAHPPAPTGPASDEQVTVIAAADPANPYGALLPWPATGSPNARPRRVPGAWLFIVDGRPVLYAGAKARHLLTFPGSTDPSRDALGAAMRALPRLPRGARRGLLVIDKVDGQAVGDSEHVSRLSACGFVTDYRGMVSTRS